MPQPPDWYWKTPKGIVVMTMPPGMSRLPVRIQSAWMAMAAPTPEAHMSTETPQKQLDGFFSANRRAASMIFCSSTQQTSAALDGGHCMTTSLKSS